MKHLGLTFLLTIFCTVSVFATAQIPDVLFYKGEKYMLHTNPMEPFFEANPEFRSKTSVTSTALWRGYIAAFEIKDEQLYVKDIGVLSYSEGKRETESILSEIFPDENDIKASWFTGLLVVPCGKMVSYVHMGYASAYKSYLLFEILDGKVIKSKKFKRKEYEKFKDKQFQAFKNTDEYRKLVGEMLGKDPSMTTEFVDDFLRIYVVDYSSKILVE